MPVIRNPFRKNAAPALHNNASSTVVEPLGSDGKPEDGKPSKSAGDETDSYKLSVVNDSGVYLPPSPTEKKSFWRRDPSPSVKNRPPVAPPPADEQFTISRESFDGYRRSFDISARSPISDTAPTRNSFDTRRPVTERASMDVRPSRMSLDVPPRMSLDSRPPQYRLSSDQRSPRMPAVEEPEDVFEEVKLDEPSRPKKLGIFSRFGGEHGAREARDSSRPKSGIFSRRDHSVEAEHESELKHIEKDDM